MEEEVRVPVLPSVYIYHDEEKYLIEVELPGVDKEKIHFGDD
ncbi:MAG: hypothetical protein QXQ20_04540 [Candidatus Nezhaarchaeales archaeon]